jgi:hypothetical protein
MMVQTAVALVKWLVLRRWFAPLGAASGTLPVRTSSKTVSKSEDSSDVQSQPDLRDRSVVSFRLSTLLICVTLCAVWLGILVYFPQPAVLIAIAVVPACGTVGILRVRRRSRGLDLQPKERWAWFFCAAMAWLGLYILSLGPVVAFALDGDIDSDAAHFVYAPIWWLHDETPLKGVLEWYGELWGWP